MKDVRGLHPGRRFCRYSPVSPLVCPVVQPASAGTGTPWQIPSMTPGQETAYVPEPGRPCLELAYRARAPAAASARKHSEVAEERTMKAVMLTAEDETVLAEGGMKSPWS